MSLEFKVVLLFLVALHKREQLVHAELHISSSLPLAVLLWLFPMRICGTQDPFQAHPVRHLDGCTGKQSSMHCKILHRNWLFLKIFQLQLQLMIPNSDRKLWISPSCTFNVRGEVGQNFIELVFIWKRTCKYTKCRSNFIGWHKGQRSKGF